MAQVLDIQAINQTFTLPMEGVIYSLRLLWNERAQVWTLDIATTDGVDIVSGVALTLGMNPMSHLCLGIGSIVLYDISGTDAEATADSLNASQLVMQLTEAET